MMEYKSKRQLRERFQLTHSELEKIISNSAYQKGRGTYFQVDTIKVYIDEYIENKKKYKTDHEMTGMYEVSSHTINTLILENKLKPIFVEGIKSSTV